MPLYEFKCVQCASILEVLQKVSDPPPAECPKCGGKLKKLLSAPAIQFKGSGFYITDYAKKKKIEKEEKPKKKKKNAKTEAAQSQKDPR